MQSIPSMGDTRAADDVLRLIRERAEQSAALRVDHDDILNNPLALFVAGYRQEGHPA